MSHKWRISLLALACLAGLTLAWGAVRAAGYARSAAPPTPDPTPQALFDDSGVTPADAAPGSQRQRDPLNPDAPAISFIDSPDATCYLPRPGTDACYITWRYLNVSAAASQYIISMTVNINNHNRAYFSGFFQTQMYIPGEMLGKGFRVACGVPGSGNMPGYGRQYPYTIRARETSGLGSANYGMVTCPGDRVPLRSLQLSGPTDGVVGAEYIFTASVDPITATQPITYVWEVSDQPVITQTDGLSNTQAFTWVGDGAKTVKVSAHNPANTLTLTQTITIIPLTPLTSLTLNGPLVGKPHQNYTFSAVSAPLSATLPITYAWSVTDFPPLIQTDGLSDSQAFTWNTTGAKSVQVAASNPVSSLARTLTILIEPYRIYFPLQGK